MCFLGNSAIDQSIKTAIKMVLLIALIDRRKIREKIESDSSNPQYLETAWGSGNRFSNR